MTVELMRETLESQSESESIQRCIECSGSLIETHGFLTCINCGLVNERIFLSSNPFRQMAHAQIISTSFFPNAWENTSFPLTVRDHAMPKQNKKIIAYRKMKKLVNALGLPKQVFKQSFNFFMYLMEQNSDKIKNSSIAMAIAIYIHAQHVTYADIISEFKKQGRRISQRVINRLIMDLNLGRYIREKKKDREKWYLHRFIAVLMPNSEYRAHCREKYELSPEHCQIMLFKTAYYILKRVQKYETKKAFSPVVLTVTSIYTADRSIAKKKKRHAFLTQKICGDMFPTANTSIRQLSADFFKSHIQPAIRFMDSLEKHGGF